jgi:hypothetical protein
VPVVIQQLIHTAPERPQADPDKRDHGDRKLKKLVERTDRTVAC